MSLHDADVWNLHNYTKITFWEKPKHSPFTIFSVTILFTVLMYDTLHDFPFSVDNCYYLPNVTNEIKPTSTVQYVMWYRHFTQAVPHCPISAHFTQAVPQCPVNAHFTQVVPHCPISAHFVTIHFLHSISSSTKCNIMFFNSVKFLSMQVVKFLFIFVAHQ